MDHRISDLWIPEDKENEGPFGIYRYQLEWLENDAADTFDFSEFVQEELAERIPDEYIPEDPQEEDYAILPQYQRNWIKNNAPESFDLTEFVRSRLNEVIPDEHIPEEHSVSRQSPSMTTTTSHD